MFVPANGTSKNTDSLAAEVITTSSKILGCNVRPFEGHLPPEKYANLYCNRVLSQSRKLNEMSIVHIGQSSSK